MSAAAAAPLLGSTQPRISTPPLRELTPDTSLGFECIAFAEEVLGISLLPWQEEFLKRALEVKPDGSFRFRTVVLLVARQSGKSTVLQVLTLWAMVLNDVRLVAGAAQNLSTAVEIWKGVLSYIQGSDELRSSLVRQSNAGGNHEFELRSGSRYKVLSPKLGAGRGLAVDLVVLDEVREQKNWDTWASIANTTMARPNAQIYAVSNAGDESSVVLKQLRDQARGEIESGEHVGSSLGIFEWSAPDGCDITDREAWAAANPGLGYTITEDALKAALAQSEAKFRTEALCQWVTVDVVSPFGEGAWEAVTDEGSRRDSGAVLSVGLDVSYDRSKAWLAVAAPRADGAVHVEVVAQRAGVDWVADYLATQLPKWGAEFVALQGRGAPASALIDEIQGAGVRVVRVEGSDLGASAGLLFDYVRDSKLRHRSQPDLNLAAAAASVKPLGDSWLFDRQKSPVDVAPLTAVQFALWALVAKKPNVETAYAEDSYGHWWD